ncbi:MAG: GIY-YIG nuclease family protein [Janthinobacterium lividum]
MLLHNYGLFWLRSDTHWGQQGNSKNPGHLKGVPAKNVTSKPVDFADQQGIYALYDDAFELVYIGQAGANDQQRLLGRLRNHRSDQLADRWTRFSWFGVRMVNPKSRELRAERVAAHPNVTDVLNHMEAVLIAVAEPRKNLQGGRFGEKVEQFRQYRDDAAFGPDQAAMVRQLWEALKTDNG